MSRNPSLPLALLLALPAAACLDRSSTDDAQDVSTAIEHESGGFDTSDEPPAFGAAAELDAAAIERDAVVTDALAGDPAAVALDRESVNTGFRVAVLWGKLPADRGATESRDWTGSLKISSGGLVVHRTIGFEDRTDMLLPRTSLDTVSFQSVTKPYVDGLALNVLSRPSASTAALTLTYTPADGSTAFTLDLAQLADGPIVVDAGGGFKIIAIGHRRQADPCDRGFMRGRWHVVSPNLGRFLGVVTDEGGAPIGHVRGVFGQRRDGNPVLFGKFVDREGRFRGILAGTYGDGQFRARWIVRGGDHGVARGVYFPGATERSGGFLGRWAETSCAADAPPPAPPANDTTR
jgi:hypothetical protein